MTDPLTASVMIILGKYTLDKSEDLIKEVGPKAAAKAGELFKTAVGYLRRDPKSEVIAKEYEADPETYAKPLEKKLEAAMQENAELKAQLGKLLSEYQTEAKTHAPSYNATLTGSGAIAQGPGATAVGERGVYVGGSSSGPIVTGDRNEVIQAQGDVVKGDKIGGDKVGGDKIEVGDISGSTGIAIGRKASAVVTQGISGEELTAVFAAARQEIAARPIDPNIDKEELEETVAKIETEADKGEEANESKLERWIHNLATMAPDIVDVMAASLAGPVAGGTMVLKKIIDKVKAEQGA